MVRHIILWTLKAELSPEEKEMRMQGIKTGLESLVGKVPGLLSLHVQTEKLPTSTVELMLESTLESFEALKGYSVHPEHVYVANTFVRPYTAVRSCIDFEVPEE